MSGKRQVRISKSQVDLLGARLTSGDVTDSDQTVLDDWRKSFGPQFDEVMETCRSLGFEPTGRFGKSTRSIVAKLKRETIRLSQVQDIVGCRVVLESEAGTEIRDAQDVAVNRIVEALSAKNRQFKVYDRRLKPSYGYRAVHVVPIIDGKPVEIQVRTPLQHQYAQIVEFVADQLGNDVKYGGGHPILRDSLGRLADLSHQAELPNEDPEQNGEPKTTIGSLVKGLGGLFTVMGEVYHLSRTMEALGAKRSDLLSGF